MMPQFALQSQLTKGFVEMKAPPHQKGMFAQADGATLSLAAAFAFNPAGKGAIISLGDGAYLTLCEPTPGTSSPSLCSGHPWSLKPPKVSPSHHPSPHHRRLLLDPAHSKTAEWVVEKIH
jgi:hypothetical protein